MSISFNIPGRTSGNSWSNTIKLSNTPENVTVKLTYSAPNGGYARIAGQSISNGGTLSLNGITSLTLQGCAYDGGCSGTLTISL